MKGSAAALQFLVVADRLVEWRAEVATGDAEGPHKRQRSLSKLGPGT